MDFKRPAERRIPRTAVLAACFVLLAAACSSVTVLPSDLTGSATMAASAAPAATPAVVAPTVEAPELQTAATHDDPSEADVAATPSAVVPADPETPLVEWLGPTLSAPPGHDVVTIELERPAAFGGLVRPGDVVVLAASNTDSGNTGSNATLVGLDVELLGMTKASYPSGSQEDKFVVEVALTRDEEAILDTFDDSQMRIVAIVSGTSDAIMMVTVPTSSLLDSNLAGGDRVDMLAKDASGPGTGTVLLTVELQSVSALTPPSAATSNEAEWQLLFTVPVNDALSTWSALQAGVEIRANQ